METVLKFLKKLKIELPLDPAIPLLVTYPKKMKKTICCLQVKDQWLQLYHTGLLFNVLQGRESANKTGNDPVGPLDVGPFSSLFCPLVEQQKRTVRTATTNTYCQKQIFSLKK